MESSMHRIKHPAVWESPNPIRTTAEIRVVLATGSSGFRLLQSMVDDGGDRPAAALELAELNVVSALGRGAKGVVFLAQKLASGEWFALKAISKALIESKGKSSGDGESSEYKRVCFEQRVLSLFRHPLLPKLRGVFESEQLVGYAIDYCPGRDLNCLRKNQTEKMFSDDMIRFYAAELVLALEYLHGLGIVYRDLKPENIVIQENGHIMLVDFDLSTKLSAAPPETPRIVNSPKKKRFSTFYKCCNSGILPDDSDPSNEPAPDSARSESNSLAKSNSFVGTEEYVAPEIILGKGHDFAVDWWSLGVVLYEMLYGTTPFKGSNRKETFYRILAKTPTLVGETTSLRDLIGKLLEKDPKQRIGLEEIKGHDFFKRVDWDLILEISRPPFIPMRTEMVDTDAINGIDVESFVQEVFKSNSEAENTQGNVGKNENSNEIREKENRGDWVGGLNCHPKSNNFLIF